MTSPIVLASASPRRLELLGQIGVACEVAPQDVDESLHHGESPTCYVRRLARDKAAAAQCNPQVAAEAIVIAADTIVVCADTILGKPVDQQDALRMLALLSDRAHQVLTAVVVACQDSREEVLVASEVSFCHISSEDAACYWATGEPADKAGAYAIQGLGAVFIKQIVGSYSGVMGLPLYETSQMLQQFGIDCLSLAEAAT